MRSYADDPTAFVHTLKDSLKEQARVSRDRGDASELYSITNARYDDINQYIIEATSFEGALLKYCKLVKKEYGIDELSALLEEMQDSVGPDAPVTMEMAMKWLRGKTKSPASPWNATRRLQILQRV